MPPQPRPKPTDAERQQQVLDALRQVGGTLNRSDLRVALRGQLGSDELTRVTDALSRRRAIKIVRVSREVHIANRRTHWINTTLYRLAESAKDPLPFATRPPRPEPRKPRSRRTPDFSTEELADRVADALKALGGRAQRDQLRTKVRPVLKTPTFNAVIAELVRQDRISIEKVTLAWVSPRGQPLPFHATIYALKGRRKRKAPAP
jgi:hypothetical protein